ncbi:hypothetical protein [Pseudoroseicyclus sp. CXY001]|uniref:hypothetical protein n=1 Tax=Pseudoroseicyclus sp. CXY001 TaxID=3242492 RepID=UPI0035713BB1
MTDQTPPDVDAAATTRIEVPMEGILLLGTFAAPGGGAALLRLSDGSIARVTPGEATGAGEVLAIAAGQVTFRRSGGEEITLGMPG